MQTSLPEQFRLTPKGRRAEDILRSCVHCGFCNATCPTYRLLGDELDGPRGRIYLIKDMLEQEQVNTVAVTHLDRCLTCRACETTCPSGVAYGELLEIGRDYVHRHYRRGLVDRFVRSWLQRVVPHPRRMRPWIRLGRLFRWFLPRRLRQQLPPTHKLRKLRKAQPVAETEQMSSDAPTPRVLLLDGCVQRLATPQVNAALERLLIDSGVTVLRAQDEGCCGALDLHLGNESAALDMMRRNVDALEPVLAEVDAVISTASGCGITFKDYARLLGADEAYALRARALSKKVRDVGEYLAQLGMAWTKQEEYQRVALHIPCTLQHGQHAAEHAPALLKAAGYDLLEVRDAHLCCGSAGTYAMLQPRLSEALAENKIDCLSAQSPDVIATANVGCQTHLAARSGVPVVHWLELLKKK